MGVTHHQQWTEHITNESLLKDFGIPECLRAVLMERRMRWLSHLCWMSDTRQPKKLLFGELVNPRPFHGAKQQWRDVATADLRTLDVPLDSWYVVTEMDGTICVLGRYRI